MIKRVIFVERWIETESELRLRRIRHRPRQRRSLTNPRPPPSDKELYWKSRQRNSDDSGSESDDEQHLLGSYFHQQQRPNMSQYVSDGGAPGLGGSGSDGSGEIIGKQRTEEHQQHCPFGADRQIE